MHSLSELNPRKYIGVRYRRGPLRPEIGKRRIYEMDDEGRCAFGRRACRLRPAEAIPTRGASRFSLHEFGDCSEGDPNMPSNGRGRESVQQPHGNHAGDLPFLVFHDGVAKMCFYTNKFKPADVVGKAVIIHENPDDYRSQPSGNAGRRLACGIIRAD